MHDMVKRHDAQLLRTAGHSQAEVAKIIGLSLSTVRRIDDEPPVTTFGGENEERKRREVGRPSKVEPFRNLIIELCAEKDNEGSPLQAKEIVRRIKNKGYKGGNSAACALIASPLPSRSNTIGEHRLVLRMRSVNCLATATNSVVVVVNHASAIER